MTAQTAMIVIPAYNEAATIRSVAQRALAYGPVIVVDDGSTDGTVGQLDGLAVVVLRNERNSGKAFSLWRGMQHALSSGADAVITLDGDGQHAPDDIPRLLSVARRLPSTVVIAARLRLRDSAPRARRIANGVADFWISWAAGQSIVDSQSGFRLYPAQLLRSYVPRMRRNGGFVFESEILIDAVRGGFACVAVPIDTVYHAAARPSHFRPVADITHIVWMVAGKLLARGLYLQGLWRVWREPARIED
ncbi:MAG: glycosyltransferase family 2 protein [Pseudomonadota bacterium]